MPDWIPKVPLKSRILVVGASGGIGFAVTKMLLNQGGHYLGAHYATNSEKLLSTQGNELKLFKKELTSGKDCRDLVNSFCDWKGGIDCLVVAHGSIARQGHFLNISDEEWSDDIFVNLSSPFYIASESIKVMKKNGTGGRLVFFGTESAVHSASPTSLAYGISKLGLECMVRAFAKEGAKDNILVNGIRLGYIKTGFHERWQKKTAEDMKKRMKMIPIERAGTPEEVAAMTLYLLSEWSGFITGQMIPLTGGDWL